MNFDDIVSLISKGEKIHNLPLRVTFYARVSTDSDIQLNSLDNQLKYYENYIKSNTNWTFIDGYIEEGVSGVRVDKREAFKKMIKDANNHKFDLIITKEVSRFARDLEDSIHYIRLLKDCGVGIFFENQNLNTFDQNSELILNIMFNLAQDESKKLSTRIKFGHKMAISKGHVLGSSNIIGYKKDNCKLIIDEEEAKFIKKVFELYSTGEYGLYKLGKVLFELGYSNKNNNIYDKDTLKRIIENPKYKGYYRAHTYEIMDYRTKRRKKISKEEQIIYKCKNNEIPPIISEELWNKANEILNHRTIKYKTNNNWSGGLKYPLSSKIFCQEHNVNYSRTHNKHAKWCCRNYLQYGLSFCKSPIIKEKELYNIINQIIKEIFSKDNTIIKEMITLYSNIDEKKNYQNEIKNIENSIKKIKDKKNTLIDLIINKQLKKEWINDKFEIIDYNLKKLYQEKIKINKQLKKISNNNCNDEIYNSIKEELNNGILEAFIRKFINKIIISKIDNNRKKINLDIYITISKNNKQTLFLKNQLYYSNEPNKNNKYIYNVYI